MKNLIMRAVTGAIIVALVLAMIFTHRYALIFGLLFLSNVAIYELSLALKKIGFKPYVNLAYLFNSLIILSGELLPSFFINLIVSLYLIIVVILMTLSKDGDINMSMASIFLILYISFPYYYLTLINNKIWILYIFGITSSTDTFAYIVGMLFGRHKLIERLSPKKTVEGAFGGLLGSLLFTYVFISLFKLDHKISIYLVSIVASVLSQLGDLLASFIKRKSGLKDYGYIFIGHGGVMDRFDSFLLVSPVIYFFIIAFGG